MSQNTIPRCASREEDAQKKFAAFMYKKVLNNRFIDVDMWHIQKHRDITSLNSVSENENPLLEDEIFIMSIKVITEQSFNSLFIPVQHTLFGTWEHDNYDPVDEMEDESGVSVGSVVSSYPTVYSDAEKRLSLLLIA